MSEENIMGKIGGSGKGAKAVGIIVSIIMILLGTVTFFEPIIGQAIAIWMMVAGLFLFGIEEIVTFCIAPKERKDGCSLALGIIWVILCIVLFISAINADLVNRLVAQGMINYFLAIMIAFTCIFSGINNLCLSGKAEEMGNSKGGMIASGILFLLAGIIILGYPIGSLLALSVIFALFLAIGGIGLLCRCLSSGK